MGGEWAIRSTLDERLAVGSRHFFKKPLKAKFAEKSFPRGDRDRTV